MMSNKRTGLRSQTHCGRHHDLRENEDLPGFLTPPKLTSGSNVSLPLNKRKHSQGKTGAKPLKSKRMRRIVYVSDEDDNLPVPYAVSPYSSGDADADADFFDFDDDEEDRCIANETEEWLQTINNHPLLENTVGNPSTLRMDIAQLKTIEVQLLDKFCIEVKATLDEEISLLQRNKFYCLLELRDTLRNKINTLTNLCSKHSAATKNILKPLTPSTTPQNVDCEKKPISSTIVASQFPHLENQETAHTKFSDNVQNDGATREFDGDDFSHSKEMRQVLKEKFGLEQFRENQQKVINATLLNNDCFVLMPTGGGKSLCYQLPAVLLSPAVTVVISPLISLIQDQMQHLGSQGISAAHLTDHDTTANGIYTELSKERPSIPLLYVTPEKVTASARLMSTIESLYERKLLARFVIDEVHCVSQWGHDFRPEYNQLSMLRDKFPAVPMILLTATATARVRFDILAQLKIDKPKLFIQSFNRPNLTYEVRHRKKSEVMPEMISLLKERFPEASGIVYCISRNDCKNVAKALSKAGLSATAYHAGLTDAKRHQVHQKWLNDKFKVICATIAFGMGIDKPNCRFVIHHSLPKSMEGYYQETGRAGRDGNLSICILYFNYQDKVRIMRMIERDSQNEHAKQVHIENLNRMMQFCIRGECRRVQLLNYFDEIPDDDICKQNGQSVCDNCSLENEFQEQDMTKEAQFIVNGIKMVVGSETKRRANFTMAHFADVFKGSTKKTVVDTKHTKLDMHGKGNHLKKNDIEILIHKLIVYGYLAEDFTVTTSGFATSYLRPGRRAKELLQGRTRIKINLSSRQPQTNKNKDTPTNSRKRKSFNKKKENKKWKKKKNKCKQSKKIELASSGYNYAQPLQLSLQASTPPAPTNFRKLMPLPQSKKMRVLS